MPDPHHTHSFSSLSYDRTKASSKVSCPHSAIQNFLLQMRVSSSFPKVIQQLPTSFSSSSCYFCSLFYLSFNNPLCVAVSTQNVTNPVRKPAYTELSRRLIPVTINFMYRVCHSEILLWCVLNFWRTKWL